MVRSRIVKGFPHFFKALILSFGLAGVSAPAEPVDLRWSLRPLGDPEVPEISGDGWSRNPVDRFILSKQVALGLRPSVEADRRTWLRRVYFDLVGLPPTPGEIRAFENDPSADPHAAVVDRLLASPRYGERSARHWMDLVHYAETHGHDQDRIRTNAWPYRDYLIDSFNRDKPFGQFVQEQIAGDVLYPENPQATVAMGFLATGPWDESSLRDIRDDTLDRQIARYIDRDDIVTTTMTAFTSTTVQCARCHDHKFDPISQNEYYGLQAVFASTDKAERFFDDDPKVHAERQRLLREQADLKERTPEMIERLLGTSFQAEVGAWEQSFAAASGDWEPIQVIQYSATGGAVLEEAQDRSYISSGVRPERSTYVVSGESALAGITAFRLEVLSDERLPVGGPGRQDNGNLHLSEFQLQVVRQDEPGHWTPVRDVEWLHASADFDQEGWGVSRAIDGKSDTAWGIFPAVGLSHEAVFEAVDAITLARGERLRFVLHQDHGGGHLIGRFRVSGTTRARPVRARKVPEVLAKALATPAGERSRDEILELAVAFMNVRIEERLKGLPEPRRVYAGGSLFIPDGSFKPAGAPRPVHILRRGNIKTPRQLAIPGALSCVPGMESHFQVADPEDEGERRAALARWIADPSNPLTWRSIANRVWLHHFGRGLVDTPNDFGEMGSEPTHPELLDWLARSLLANQGSLKSLHRLITLSATYRQSSASNPEAERVDSGNAYLWRMNRSRLDAEGLRDAVLTLSGELDLRMGGPSDKHFELTPGIHVTPVVDYTGFDVADRTARRRSVYRFVFRTLPDPFMDVLDCADSSQLTPQRNSSVTPLQALSMLNNPFMVRYSATLADRVSRMATERGDQLRAVWWMAIGREATAEELGLLVAYAEEHGMANACRFVLNCNEFMFVN